MSSTATSPLRDEPILEGRNKGVVTGEQGGKIPASFLFKLELQEHNLLELSDGLADKWLKKQQPRFLLHPAQNECIKQALKFLPKLQAYESLVPPESEDEESFVGFWSYTAPLVEV